jgi:hypothetical protein
LIAVAFLIPSQLPSVDGGRSSLRNLRTLNAVVGETQLKWIRTEIKSLKISSPAHRDVICEDSRKSLPTGGGANVMLR